MRIMKAMRAGTRHRRHRLSRQRGVTALEYGILAAIVALIIGGVVYTNLSSALTTAFSTVSSAATSAVSH
ncbi:Flp family type IVb pilin [Pandoraea morbifera]